MVIRHLLHEEIDKKEWDEYISEANNGFVYALSWYLDVVSPNWEALISDDFKFIMPVPIKKKFKVPYIVQPLFTQQLGIFSKEPINIEIIKDFIKKLPSYSYQTNLNAYNYYPDATEYPNYILSLDKPYIELANIYSKNTVRNIKKAINNNLSITENVDIENFMLFYESVSKKLKPTDCVCMKELIKSGIEKNIFYLKGVIDKENKLIAALCQIEFNNRITYLILVSNDAGKKSSAMFYLIDSIIRQNSATNKILDFEGSAIEGIARFYKGFGAINQPYYIIKNLRPSFLVGKI